MSTLVFMPAYTVKEVSTASTVLILFLQLSKNASTVFTMHYTSTVSTMHHRWAKGGSAYNDPPSLSQTPL